jgi:serine/threonine protein kinase
MEWKQGTPVGEYQILGELDQGSKGIIYTVRHVRTHEDAVLVVLQDPDLPESGRLSGLECATGLEHPNFAAIKELWKFDDFVFIVSELLEGRPLHDHITSRGENLSGSDPDAESPFLEAVALMRQVASALGYAHAHNLVHCDLRAGDIVVRSDGTPVITGLGWAALLGRPPKRSAAQAPAEAPEDRPADPGGDVRSAGWILLRLVAGLDLSGDGRSRTAGPAGGMDLPYDLSTLIDKAVGCDPDGQKYDANAFSQDLDRFVDAYSRPVADVDPAPQADAEDGDAEEAETGIKTLLTAGHGPSPSSRPSSFWAGMALSVLVLAIFVFVLVASMAVSGVLPRTLQKLSLEVRTSNFQEAVTQSRNSDEPGTRIETLTGLLAASPGLPGSARARMELSKLYMQKGCWKDALSQMLIVLHMQPSLVKGRDLLDLALLLYDNGQTAQYDWLLNRIIDGYQGSESAWRAIFLKKRLVLVQSALNRIVHETGDLLEGPLKRRAALKEEGARLKRLAGSIRLKSMARVGDNRVFGDFLPPAGDEIAVLEGNKLRVSGLERNVEWSLDGIPLHLWTADMDGSGMERILAGYPSGRIEIYDPRKGVLERTIRLRGRLHREILAGTDPEGNRLLIVPMTVRDRASLTVIPMNSDNNRKDIVHTTLEGWEVTALLAVDMIEHSPGEEIVAITLGRQGSLITILAAGAHAGEQGVLHRQTIAGEVRRAVKLDASRILLGLSTWYVQEGMEPTGRRERAGLYLLGPTFSPNNGSGARTSISPDLEPVKILEPPLNGRGAVILDACAGDFMGGGSLQGAFLVCFPGWLEFEPETRILLFDGNKACTWFHCPGASALMAGKLESEGRDSMVVDVRSSQLGVTFQK